MSSFFRLSLCAVLVSTQATMAQSPTQRVIFPGEKLPAELTYQPLRMGTDVPVASRDWFMLKDKDLALTNPVPGKRVEFSGPVLDNNNAQIYFRIASGMILKESMIRMGMNPSQAVRYLEAVQESGADFATTPLTKMGPLPKGLAELYDNWDRPLYKMALLPYLLLPLSVAYDQSNLQHFALAGVDDKPAQKTCSAITSVYPLGPVQTRVNDKSKIVEDLTTELRNAQARLQQSNMDQVRMTQDLRNYSGQIDNALGCFSSVNTRISRGGAMPTEACMKMAQEVMLNAQLQDEWTKFITQNLKNENGDFADKQQAEEKLKNLEARLTETQNLIQSLKDQQAKAQQEQVQAREKVQQLNVDLVAQKAEETKSSSEKSALQDELKNIQTLNHKLETGAFEGSEADKQTAIAATQDRAKRMAAIRTRLSQILQTEVKFQVNQAAIIRQIEFLTATIDQKNAALQSIQSQLNGQPNGLEARAAGLTAEVKAATDIFLQVSDQAKFSEYVISILNRRLSELSKSRDDLFGAVKKEEALAETYKTQIATAQKNLDTQSPALLKDVTDLESMIASYKDVANMGWFLETDCAARANFAQGQLGIYLSRAKITAPTVPAASKQNPSPKLNISPSDAGRWGMFNMDYNVFKAAIQNGVLLNVSANVQLAVQQIVENYDYALAQQLDPAVTKCADPEANRGHVGNALKVAFSIWNLGNDASAKSRSVACRSTVQAANQANAANPARDFQISLGKLIAFDGSVLDLALPKAGQSHSKDLIEREAIQLLGRELAPLTGFPRKGAPDRDALIKAMIRVLATDYEAEAQKQRASSNEAGRFEFVFATQAPGGEITGGRALQIGAEYPVNTLASVMLYNAPVTDTKYASGLQISFREKVKVLSEVNAGWVKVLARGKELWMPARPIASQILTDESGVEVSGFQKLQNCAEPRLVNLRGVRSVQRLVSNIQTITDRRGISRINVGRTGKVAPALATKSYLSCEKFSLNGQVAAVRLVEVQVLKAANGETIYIPAEDIGGYALMNDQIVEGAQINPATWSSVQ